MQISTHCTLDIFLQTFLSSTVTFISNEYINILVIVRQMMVNMTKISVRIDDELTNLINDYAEFIDMDLSKTLRELIKEGLMNKTTAKLFSNWQDKIGNRNPFNFEECDKCGGRLHIQFYHIDGDINNFESTNIA